MEAVAGPPTLWELCLQAAATSEYWRVQRRLLSALPEDSANELLRHLLEQRRIAPPQLELFQHSATAVRLAGGGITAAHLSYLGCFSALRDLRLQRCTKLRATHLHHLTSLAPTLQHLDLSGCGGLQDDATPWLVQLTSLQHLDVSGTALGDAGVASLSQLSQLTSLYCEEVDVADTCCQALAQLTRLQHLRLAGAHVSDEGMAHLAQLRRLTSLDISYTAVLAPPVVPSLQHLSMVHCMLGLQHGSLQEADWLDTGTTLPNLQELQLAKATTQPPHGNSLLQQLVAGASGALQRLSLQGAEFGCGLSMLAAATALTWLDLSGTCVSDHHLEDVALLPLDWLSLADTSVGDEGVAQLLASPLHHLDLNNTQVTDVSWAVLAQLPLRSLNLSGSRFVATRPLEAAMLASLTSLQLLRCGLDDRSCRHLAAALPQLLHLQLGASGVGDKGLRALCSLPKIEHLRLEACDCISDAGLLRALPRCPTLRRLELSKCWLVSATGLVAAAAAARQTGGTLQEALLDEAAMQLPPPSRSLAKAAGAGQAGSCPSSASTAPITSSQPRGGATAGRLPAEVLQHDERIAYSRDELLELQAASGAGALQLRTSLPPDLLSPPTPLGSLRHCWHGLSM